MSETARALRQMFERYLTAIQEVSGSLPITEHDPALRSPCELGEPDADGTITWRPVPRKPKSDLAMMERECGATLPDGLRDWFGAWWCMPIEASLFGEPMVLLGITGPEDEVAVAQRWAGHVAARRARGVDDTVPVGAFMDGRILTVSCPGGEVRLESATRSLSFVAASVSDLFGMLVLQTP
jgi:SecY interacting protein Syd